MKEKPIALRGKAKEILALIVSRRGKEISNEEIYRTVWENRPYSNSNMTVYYNALRRLRDALEEFGIRDLLISTARGQMVDVSRFDCDYYDWLDGETSGEGVQLEDLFSEYSWSEYLDSSYKDEYYV
ncbi:MAG: winged helix-turn-helix domain-containing protein [Oscillospiraceae bacterium]|nr:winged helix-turn-helix domain-containing protein [Oscillospiraceae bacterium]